VRNLKVGDRVVIPSTIACGSCAYCRAGYYAQCDDANPNGKDSGTAFLGGPKTSGPFDGLQAEYACVPFAHEFQTEVKKIVSKSKPDGDNWHPGDAPSQVADLVRMG
jgi:threonine dehydrogenase-like Zn-dependent dehydrogenase